MNHSNEEGKTALMLAAGFEVTTYLYILMDAEPGVDINNSEI